MNWLKRLFGRKPSPIRKFFKGGKVHAVIPCCCGGEIECEWVGSSQLWVGKCNGYCDASLYVEGKVPLDDLIDPKTNLLFNPEKKVAK